MIFITLISQNSNALTVINEIMYNPDGNDNNKEFIEIYSEDYKNLSNFIIEDLSSEDILKLVYYYEGNYSLIVEDGFDYNGINASIYTVGSTIGNNLNNDYDAIIFRDSNRSIIDIVVYSSDFGADGNKSLERRFINESSNDKDNWMESRDSEGTPGRENSIFIKDLASISINEFLPDPIGDDDASLPNGEWIELYNSANYNVDLSDLFFLDDFGHKILIDEIHVKNSTTIKADNFLTVYMNGFSGFLNNDNDKIKLYYLNDMIDEVSYDFSREGISWAKLNGTWGLSTPTPDYKNENTTELFKSSVFIRSFYLGNDYKAKFGDQVLARVDVYKGDTNKYSISIWAEKNKIRISKETKVNVYDKFENHTFVLPVQLDPNCNNKFKDGEYKLIIEGLDASDSKSFKIEGIRTSLCDVVYKEKKLNVEDLELEFLEIPEQISMDDEAVIKIKADNNALNSNEIELWSYIYKGPNSLSGEREKNRIKVDLPKGGSSIIELKNDLEGHIEPGDYKLKIKVKKEGRKTTQDFTSDIKITDEQVTYLNSYSDDKKFTNDSIANRISGSVVYSSSDLKAKNSAGYLLIITLLLVVIIILFRKGL